LERAAGAFDGRLVLGVDEVGRGPLAGPVTAAAAWIDLPSLPMAARRLIADSKTLSEPKRAAVLLAVAPYAKTAVAWASVEEIDRLNILHAALLAMSRAVDLLLADLKNPPDLILVDGNRLPRWPHPSQAVVKGDAVCLSIALASIAAKQARDAEMARLAQDYPGYGWERNAGYGTAQHKAGLATLGVTPHHRKSFAPVRARLDMDTAKGG
jgi:ribonuclease HII